MTKVITSIYLDLELVNYIKKERLNISKTVNAYLRYYFGLNEKFEEIKEIEKKEVLN